MLSRRFVLASSNRSFVSTRLLTYTISCFGPHRAAVMPRASKRAADEEAGIEEGGKQPPAKKQAARPRKAAPAKKGAAKPEAAAAGPSETPEAPTTAEPNERTTTIVIEACKS